MTVPPPGTRAVPVTLAFERYDATHGTAYVIDRSPPARLRRALTALAICWGLGFLCVFVPVAHFVLVPAWFVIGIAFFVIKLREECSLVEVRGRCPRCKDDNVMPQSGVFKDGRKMRCNQCAEALTLKVEPSALPAAAVAAAQAAPAAVAPSSGNPVEQH